MASMQELLMAGKMFSDGVQSLAVNQGINDASDQVNQLNSSVLDWQQKRQQQTAIAQNLALKLVGAGAQPAQVTQAQAAIAPQQYANGTDMVQQGVLTGDDSLVKMGKAQMTVEEQKQNDLAVLQNKLGMQKDAANNAATADQNAAKVDTADTKQFNNMVLKPFDSQTKDMSTALDSIDNMQALSQIKNSTSDMAVRSSLARVIGNERGKIPMQEIQQYTGSPDLFNKIQRVMQSGTEGNILTQKDRDQIDATLAAAKKAKEAALAEKLQQHAGRSEELGLFSKEDALKKIAGGSPRLKRLAGIGQELQQLQGQQQQGAVGTPSGIAPANPNLKQVPKTVNGVPTLLWQDVTTGQYYKQ